MDFSRPIVSGLDPLNPSSLVALALGSLPPQIIASPALREQSIVKTLNRPRGLHTEIQQFRADHTRAIRSIGGAVHEFSANADEIAVLDALERTAAFDVASVRRALLALYHDDLRKSELIEDCSALSFDDQSQAQTQAYTRKFTRALFAKVFDQSMGGISSTSELVAELDRAYRSEDPAQAARAKEHIAQLQAKFRVPTPERLMVFFADFELLITAVTYYRRYFAELQPHMVAFQAELPVLAIEADPIARAMLADVATHLGETMAVIKRFFYAFDSNLDRILSAAEPGTFRDLQENLQGAYATIGGMLCGWGLRLQAVADFKARRKSPSGIAKIDMIREQVCRYLHETAPSSQSMDEGIQIMMSMGQRAR